MWQLGLSCLIFIPKGFFLMKFDFVEHLLWFWQKSIIGTLSERVLYVGGWSANSNKSKQMFEERKDAEVVINEYIDC
jgi:hypothetical protein